MPKAQITISETPIVAIKDGRVVANSRDVAKQFVKRHDHVLRDISELVKRGIPNFGETPYVDPQNGQTYPSYEMDRDGFAILCMGFTGTKALKWKLDYVKAFNMMEEELRRSTPPQPTFNMRDPLTMATAFLQATEYAQEMREAKEKAEAQVEIAIAHIVERQPLVDFANAVRDTRVTYGLRTTARMLEINERVFFAKMRERYLFVEDGVLTPLAKFRHLGLFTQNLHRMEDGSVRRQTRVTGKGIDHLHAFFRSKVDLFSGAVDMPRGLSAPTTLMVTHRTSDVPC